MAAWWDDESLWQKPEAQGQGEWWDDDTLWARSIDPGTQSILDGSREVQRQARDHLTSLQSGWHRLRQTGLTAARDVVADASAFGHLITDPARTLFNPDLTAQTYQDVRDSIQASADDAGHTAEQVRARLSPEAQALDQQIGQVYDERGLFPGMWEQIKNPSSITRMVAESAPATATAILAGRFGLGPLGVATATMGAGEAQAEARDEVMALKPNEAVGIPAYDAAIAAGASHEQALERVAEETRGTAGLTGAAAGSLAAIPFLNPVETVLNRSGAGQAITGPLSRALGGRIGRSLREGVGEIPEEVGITLGSRYAQQQAGVDVDMTEGLAQTAGGAFLSGNVMGLMTPGGADRDPTQPPPTQEEIAARQIADAEARQAQRDTYDPRNVGAAYDQQWQQWQQPQPQPEIRDGEDLLSGGTVPGAMAQALQQAAPAGIGTAPPPDLSGGVPPDGGGPVPPPAPPADTGGGPGAMAGAVDELLLRNVVPQAEPAPVDTAAAQAATAPENPVQPTQAQKEAGNYRMGHVRLDGLNISIENPAGSERSGTDADGNPWSTTMQAHYGYIKGTRGADGDHIDVFIRPGYEGGADTPVFVVHQLDPATGEFDEHKVMVGYGSQAEAEAAYLSNYGDDWQGMGGVETMSAAEFKEWMQDPTGPIELPHSDIQMPETDVPWASLGLNPPPPRNRVRGIQDFDPVHHDLLDWIALNGGLHREVWQAEGIDPAEWRDRAGQRRNQRFIGRPVFRKGAGMTPHELRELMEQTEWLPAVDHGGQATNLDDDAVQMVMGAINQEERIKLWQGQEADQRVEQWEQGLAEQEQAAEMASELSYPSVEAMYDEISYAEAAMAQRDDSNEYRQLAEEYAQELAAGAPGADRLGARSPRPGSQAPTTGTAVQETGPQVYDDTPAVAGASPGFQLDGGRASTGQAPQGQVTPQRPASQPGLFAPPTAQETIAAERQRRQDETDGRTGTGDTSMLAGEGELFAGPRPQQLDVEQEAGRPDGANGDADAAPYHRFTATPSPDTGVGYMMFSDNRQSVDGAYGDYHHTFDPADIPDASVVDATSDEFTSALRTVLERTTEWSEDADALVGEANPGDIVDSAGFWDNPDLVQLAWDQVLEPNNWLAVTTANGAIVFDPAAVRSHTGDHQAGRPDPVNQPQQESAADTESAPLQVVTPAPAGQEAGRPFFSRQRRRGTRTPPKPGDQAVVGTSELLAAWTMVAGQEQAYQLPVSDSADIYTIFREVAPGFRVVSNEDAQIHAQSEGADRGWMIYTPAGREGVIFQRGGEVWINVAQSQRGESGSRIYNAVANYAYNNHLVFTGDPAGLSDTAMYRRLENMLSSALKFGTTEHLYPHERQLAGNTELGVPALDWRIGEDGHNLHQLLNASYQAVLAQAPEILGMAYNPDTRRFERADGSEVTDEQFESIANSARRRAGSKALEQEARRAAGQGVRGVPGLAAGGSAAGAVEGASGVGRRTLKRAVLTHSLVSGTREGRSRLLARLGRERGARRLLSPALQKILYSWPAFHRPASRPRPRIKAADLDARVQAVLNRWRGDVPDVYVVQSARGLPDAIRRLEGHETAEGVYLLDGRVYLVADNLPSMRRAMQVLVHEAIGHHGIEAVVGPEQWAQIVADIETMRASGKHKALFEDVDSRYDRTDPAYYREVVAIMAERGIGTSVVDRVIAAVRRFLADLGLTGTMTEDRIRQVIIDAARHVRRGEGGMFAPAAADGARMSRTEGTRRAYERRIDELFAGTAPAGPRAGVRVLDRADVLDMLGLGGGPVNLAEGKVQRGQRNHPLMTAEVWKKIPEWLDNPAAVFDSDTVTGAMVLIAPETVGGATVRMTVEPRPEGGADVHILTNAYDAPGRTPFARWFSDGLGRYVDQKEFPAVLGRSGLQLPSSAWQNKPGTRRILTEKNLAGYRRSRSAFSFAGPRAATADTMALETAQQRIKAGENAEQVRQDTGWFRGTDGKWRFEIDDSGAAWKGVSIKQGDRGLESLRRAGHDLDRPLRLSDVLDHPHLFAAYPALGEVRITIMPAARMSANQRGQLSSDVITLSDGLNMREGLSTLLHEIQHGIQRVEGFATGGSAADAFADPRMRPGASAEGLAAAHRLLNERLAAMAKPMPIEQFAREGWRGQTEITPEIREHYDEYVADVARAARNPDMARHAQSWASREWYQRLAGEVEARNVQTRQGMTADERRATPPSATQDVADADVIVVFNGQEMHSAPPPANAGTIPAVATDETVAGRQGGRAAGDDTGRGATIDETTGLPLNDDGTVTVYHHTSAESAAQIRQTGRLRSAGEPDVYVTTRAETDTGYGDTAVAIRVDPARLEIDDEFPDGRRDFRMTVGRPGGSIPVVVENDSTAPDSDGAMFSRPRQYTNEQKEFMRKAGLPVEQRTRLERLRDWVADQVESIRQFVADGDTRRQALVDRFHGIRAAYEATGQTDIQRMDGYVSARLSTGLAAVMEGVMMHGAPQWQDGVLGLKPGTKGLMAALEPVKGDLDAWLGWMVARRAKLLMGQGREHNMTEADIDAGLDLANGREAEFMQAAYDYLQIKNAILDVAEQAGLIDPAARATWDHAEYIPFYRAGEESVGPGTRRSLANQSSGIRTLRGGESVLADPLANIMRNFTRLIDASMKNNAMLEVHRDLGADFFQKVPSVQFTGAIVPRAQIRKQLLESGVPQSVVGAMPDSALEGMAKMWAVKPPTADDVVRIMRNGKAEYYRVDDPLLLRSMSAFAMKPRGAGMKVMIWAKRILTAGATGTAEFAAANTIRDSLEGWMVADENFKPLVDSIRGALNTLRADERTQELMMSGSYFAHGHIWGGDVDATAAALRRSLRAHGIANKDLESYIGTIARSPAKLWDAWTKVQSALEHGTRRAMYDAALREGKTRKEAAFTAKDLLDFSMRGDSEFIAFFTDVVPFLNARLQGLYKMGRTYHRNRKQLAMRGSMVATASLALLAWNLLAHGDAYDELPEWEKDTYWHIGPGTAYHTRIPKPFELGIIFGTAIERGARAILNLAGSESGESFGKTFESMTRALAETLALDPTPQAVKPLVEQVANRDFFRDMPIEGLADENKLPEARYGPRTSDTARLVPASVANATGMSPKRIEHLWRGYTAGLGDYAMRMSDFLVRRAQGEPYRPAMEVRDWPLIGRFVRGDAPARSTRFQSEFYDAKRKAEQVAGTIKEYLVRARTENRPELLDRAMKLQEDNLHLLGPARYQRGAKGSVSFGMITFMNRVQRQVSAIRDQEQAIINDPALSRTEKRDLINDLTQQRNDILREAMEVIGE